MAVYTHICVYTAHPDRHAVLHTRSQMMLQKLEFTEIISCKRPRRKTEMHTEEQRKIYRNR